MTTIADLLVSVGADISGFTKGMDTVDNRIDTVSKSVTSSLQDMGDGMANIGKSATLLGAPFLALGALAVKSASDSQKAVAQLDAVLKSTAGQAGVTKDAALSLASGLQKVTTFSDESVLGAENLLLTFTNIGNEIFPDTTKAALDLSTAIGQDLKSSSIQLGKALNDPVAGITALTRVGVSFTEQQKKQIEQLVKSGKTLEAQKIILAEINKEFGGSAEAAGKTFAGSLEILKNRADDLLESLGNKLIPVIEIFTNLIGDGITFLENLSEPMQTVVAIGVALGASLAVLGPVLIGIGSAISFAAPAIAALGAGLALLVSPIGLVVAALAGLVFVASQLVNFDELGKIIATGLGDALNSVKDLTGFDAAALVKTIKDKIAAAFGLGGNVLPSNVADKAAGNLADQFGSSVRKVGGTSGGNKAGEISGIVVPVNNAVGGISRAVGASGRNESGIFTGLGASLLGGFQSEIDKFTAGIGNGINLSTIQSTVETHFNDILGTIITVAGLVFGGPIGLAIGAARLVATAVNENFLGIKDFLDQSGISSAVETAFTGVRDTINNLIQSIFNPQQAAPNAKVVEEFAKFQGNNLQGNAAEGGPLALFVSDLGRGLDELKNLVDTVWNNIAPGVQSIADGIKGFVDNLQGTETGGLLRIVTAVVGVIGGIADAIIRVGSDVFGKALESIGNALPAIGSAINDFISALSNLGEGDVGGFVSNLADSLIDIGQSILDFIGVDIQIPDFATALDGWKTFFDSVGVIVQTAVTNIQNDLNKIAVAVRTSFRDIEEIASRAQILGADANTLLGRGGGQNEANKAAATTNVQGIETAKEIEKQLNDSIGTGDIKIDPSKFTTVDPAAIAAKIADPKLIQDALTQALAEGDENAISVLLPIATELGIDTQPIVDQFADSLATAGAAQIYQAQLTADVLVNAGKVDLGPLRGAINAAIANGNLAGGVPQVPGGGAAQPAQAVPHLASGGSILSDGLAYLHAGEKVLNQQQQQNAVNNAAQGGGGNVINFSPNASVDQILAELERRGIYLQPGMNAA